MVSVRAHGMVGLFLSTFWANNLRPAKQVEEGMASRMYVKGRKKSIRVKGCILSGNSDSLFVQV